MTRKDDRATFVDGQMFGAALFVMGLVVWGAYRFVVWLM